MHREVRASLKAVFADPALNSNPALIQQPWLVPNSTLPLGKGNLKCYRMYNMKYLYERGVSNQRHYNNTLNMKTQEDRTDVMFLLAAASLKFCLGLASSKGKRRREIISSFPL
ncbi:hypothetical protein P5673_007723 [Acropora cervicornis]|uniref:Uncharacterized protein n=1 Tax=Acropora cervicornis TaxID=6130 RepID=A0AAD9VBD5_ACRCE|nr:hypothetical protein P5673_007723 [Acropora cervicornis]